MGLLQEMSSGSVRCQTKLNEPLSISTATRVVQGAQGSQKSVPEQVTKTGVVKAMPSLLWKVDGGGGAHECC